MPTRVEIVVASQTSHKIDAVKSALADVVALKVRGRREPQQMQ